MKRAEQMGRIMLAGALAMVLGYYAVANEVTTNVVKILPERRSNVRSFPVWVAEDAIDQGTVIRYGNNAYFAETGGTLGTTAPTFRSGIETNGTAILRYIERGPRRGFVVQLHDAGPVRVNAYVAPDDERHFRLSGNLAHWSQSGEGCPQGAIYVVSESGTNTVTVTEW